jgi:hypothetical protein
MRTLVGERVPCWFWGVFEPTEGCTTESKEGRKQPTKGEEERRWRFGNCKVTSSLFRKFAKQRGFLSRSLLGKQSTEALSRSLVTPHARVGEVGPVLLQSRANLLEGIDPDEWENRLSCTLRQQVRVHAEVVQESRELAGIAHLRDEEFVGLTWDQGYRPTDQRLTLFQHSHVRLGHLSKGVEHQIKVLLHLGPEEVPGCVCVCACVCMCVCVCGCGVVVMLVVVERRNG